MSKVVQAHYEFLKRVSYKYESLSSSSLVFLLLHAIKSALLKPIAFTIS